MRKIYLFLLILLTFYSYGQVVNIPDAAFKSYLLSHFDTNNDNEIQVSEALAVNSMGPRSNSVYDIQDLTGLEAFTNITSFALANCYSVTSLDLSNQPLLQCINIFSNPSLTCVNIKNGNNQAIDENCSHLEYCRNLQYFCVDDVNYVPFSFFDANPIFTTDSSIMTCIPNDPPIYVPDTNLRNAIVLSGCVWDVNHDRITEVSEAEATGEFCINSTYTITDLGTCLENFITLQRLSIYNNSLTTIDLSSLPVPDCFEQLDLHENNITNIDLSYVPYLSHLDLHGNDITDIDLSNNSYLINLNLSNTHITNLDLSNQIYGFESLNISNNSYLTYVNYHNGANNEPVGSYNSYLNFTNLPNLTTVCIDDITDTPLKDFILSQVGHNVTFIDNCATNVNEYSNNSINVYPNPTNDLIHINSIDNIDSVLIFDPTGMLVKQSYGENKISVKDLPAGIYILKIIDNKENTYSKTILKK